MSDAFQDREKGFERKYQLDQEQEFRVHARRDKLFGLWAAGKLVRVGSAADVYAAEVVNSNFARPGDDDMLDKVKADFKAAGVAISEADVAAALRDSESAAMQQISAEKK